MAKFMYVIEFSTVNGFNESYHYRYFDNAEDALDYANKVSYTKEAYNNEHCPTDLALVRIPIEKFSEWVMSNPNECDWPMLASWFEIDNYVRK